MSSARERQAKRRARIKANAEVYEAYLQKDRERKQLQRESTRASMSKEQLEEHHMKERIRMRNYRLRISSKTADTSQGTPYRSRQALGKALKRLQHSLPSSPRKQRFVVEKLARSVGVPVDTPSTSGQTSVSSSSQETAALVQSFYTSDDISWQAPGRKDRVIIRETTSDGTKDKSTLQIRYMMMSLREAHEKFTEENSTTKISLSKFCELRPPNVKLFEKLPHQVCLCSYHENVRLLLVALKEHTSLNVEFAAFVQQVTCDANLKECMTRECPRCATLIDEFTPSNKSTTVQYYQWKSTDNRVEKIANTDTVEKIFDELKKQLNPFLLHTHVKRKQAASFDHLKSSCDGTSIVLQVDFSENATIASQREVQAAHWHHAQVTLFTSHAWIDNLTSSSIVVISDDLTHSKHSIFAFMQCIFRNLTTKFSNIKTVNVFSDGPTSQFKQRFLFSNLHSWEQEHSFNIIWNFFATSHGKGVVDGIGGTLKRAVWRNIRAEKNHITSPQEYATLAKELCPNVTVEYIPKSDIDKESAFLDAKWERVVAVPRTHRLHCIKPLGADKVKVADTSDEKDENFRVCQIRKPTVTEPVPLMNSQNSGNLVTPPAVLNLTIGQWVVVKYEGNEFPGEVACIEESDVEVNVMHRSVNAWKWPRIEDKIFYPKRNVLRVIRPPSVAGNHGQFVFEDI